MTSHAPKRVPALVPVALSALLLLSGFCGIAYEILYTKLLGNLLGNQFTINATVLLTVLLGIGLGTLYAHRFVRYLWAIEASIGIYAGLMAALYGPIDRLLYSTVPFLGTNLYAAALAAFVLLVVPAFLIGCSIPIFACYIGTLRETAVFSTTYAIYNIGAGITALAMEFVLLRAVGLRTATVVLATLNLVVAGGLLLLTRRVALVPEPVRERVRFPRRVLSALALASIASAVFQLLMIKVAEFIFGPYNETFSLVLSTVLIGIAAGSAAAARFGLTFRGALLLSLAGLAWLIAGLETAAGWYASLYGIAVEHYVLLVLLKLGLVVVLMGLPAVGFGATIPALLRTHKDVARESGQLLFCSSMANALGFLLMAFVLHQHFDYGPILLIVTLLTCVGLLLQPGGRRSSGIAALVLVGLSFGAQAVAWDETLLYVGHKNFHSTKDLQEEREKRVFAERFKGPQDVFAIVTRDDRPFFFINGYISIPLSSTSEKLVGALFSMLSPRLDEALVLGMGSGGTAGTVALLFDHTDVVEINNVVLQNLYRMKQYNFDIENRPRVSIIHDDGIHFVKTTAKQYSLILNTVTTPLYFSSSKLYTHEFLQYVSRRLAPDGLYVTWVDGRIGDRGIDIILETLDATFDRCWLTFMKSSYYILACSDGELGLDQYAAVVANDELRDYLAAEHRTPLELVPYSVISTDAQRFRSNGEIPLNTLEHPVLEFAMARLPADRLSQFKERLRRGVDLIDVAEALSPSLDWDPGRFLFYTDLRTRRTTRLSRTLHEVVDAQFGDVADAYASAALSAAERVDSARGYRKFGRMLRNRGSHEAAVRLFDEALRLDPGIEGMHYDRGRSLLELGAWERAGADALAEWESSGDSDAAMLAAKAEIGRSRFDEALEWLDTAKNAGAEPERVAFYRGRAYEGMNDVERAVGEYERALEEQPGSERVREALARIERSR